MLKMKNIRVSMAALSALALTACGGQKEAEQETNREPYSITAVMPADSAVTTVGVEVDTHGRLLSEQVPVSRGHFAYQGTASGIDEVYLLLSGGNLCRMYAYGGMQSELSIDSAGRVAFAGSDTINGWLQEHQARFEGLSHQDSRKLMDSIVEAESASMRAALLLRDEVAAFNDSLYVRRQIGRFSEAGQPAWLVKAVENLLDVRGRSLKVNTRLKMSEFRDHELAQYDLKLTRQKSMLMLFWADTDSASVDSLRSLPDIARQYGLYEYEAKFKTTKDHRPKHIEFMTFCLHAQDSAAWLKAVDGIPGRHVYLTAGLADPRIMPWGIRSLPYNIVVDRFGNIQGYGRWGQDLRVVLNRAPNVALKTTKK